MNDQRTTARSPQIYSPVNLDMKTYNKEFFAVLSAKRRLNAQLKFISSSEQLETIKDIFMECFEDRLVNIALLEEEAFKKISKIETLKKLMQEQGISLAELMGEESSLLIRATQSTSNGNPRVSTPDGRTMDSTLPIKYRFHTKDGKECPWHGQGRFPARLKELIAEGRTLEEFAVN